MKFSSYQFGRYPFDADGTEKPIEWKILKKYSDGTALVISKYGLDAVRFDGNNNCNWKGSAIREWLNNEFYNRAFSNNDSSLILKTQLQDKIFLLSIEEAKKYFNNDEERKCCSTPYAQQTNNTRTGKPVEKEAIWWLRSAGEDSCTAAVVGLDGGIYSMGFSVEMPTVTVRPAMKINLELISANQSA